MNEYDVEDADEREIARIVKTAVTPRPIAWVSTRSEAGVDNLAPFSSYNYLSMAPPVLMVNVSKRDENRLKDTARNAIDTGEFAVNVVTEAQMEAMDHTSEGVGPEESEFDLAGVERAECQEISAARVAEAPVTMECRLRETLEIAGRVQLVGDVVYVHVDESVTRDGEIDSRDLDTVGRLGGPYYTVSEPVAFERRF
jgi:flavin reductase (DIM6/NTAB) family NADH-FMN oxidoreductase RutF